MLTLPLRLTLRLTVLISLLVMLMQVVACMLPLSQIIPIVTYNSPIILLLDVNRHVAAARRTNPSIVFDAVVSPDQQRIAFSMSNKRDIHIYVGGLFDNTYQPVSSTTLGEVNPAWSPDGSQIAFIGFELDNKRGIYTAAVDGTSSVQNVLKAGTFASPAWSPDGHFLTFASSYYRDLPDIFVIASTCRIRCDRQVLQITTTLVADTAPTWSPDGTTIAFLSNRNGDYQIFTLDMRCMQPGELKCSLQVPKQIRLQQLGSPVFEHWSLNSREVYFRAWDSITNQPALYAVKAACPSLAEGCQPRLIYNLARTVTGKRSS